MKKLLIILALILLYFSLDYLPTERENIAARTTVLTGIVLVCAYLLALLLKNAKLPKLTGYMALGIVLGPAGFNFLEHDMLERLHFLENLALAFIAITAGGELKFSRLKNNLRLVLFVLVGQIAVVFWGLFFLLLTLAPLFPFLAALDKNYLLGFAILFSATAISMSPATVIGIITELRAKGRVTEIVLSVTVLNSFAVVALFPVFVAWAKHYLIPGAGFGSELLYQLAQQFGGSLLAGAGVGVIIIWYLKYVNVERGLFLLCMAIVLTELSQLFGMEILLTAMITGILVENYSKQGEALVNGIERSSLPLYIIFFSFAGAGLHLENLQNVLWLTLFLVFTRLALFYVGNYLGMRPVSGDKALRHYSWMGYIGQAGIAVGLATIIERTFPGEIGTQLSTILIATVVLNELMGPVFFKYLLVKVKEDNKGP